MPANPARCLILACGNTLRSDDGVGLCLAGWAEQRFREHPEVQTLARHQWTPELAEDISRAQTVMFIDCCVDAYPGSVRLVPVEPAQGTLTLATHRVGPADLLALSRDLYQALPRHAMLLTIGAGSLEFGETFSEPVRSTLPDACCLIEDAVTHFLVELQIREMT